MEGLKTKLRPAPSKGVKYRFHKNKIFRPCFGFFLQGSAKETAIANSFVAVASIIIFGVSVGEYIMNDEFHSEQSHQVNRLFRPLFWLCYYIYWIAEIRLSLLLYKASANRDLEGCERWLKTDKILNVIWFGVYLLHSILLPKFTIVTQSVFVVTIFYKLYTFWVVASFIVEIKEYGHFNDPLTKLTDQDVEDFMEGRQSSARDADVIPYDTNFEIPMTCFNNKSEWTKLGEGQFGVVYRAIMKVSEDPNAGSLSPGSDPGPGPGPGLESASSVVAIKTISPLITDAPQFKTLLSELKIRTYIGKHENIVNLIGACTAHIRERKLDLVVEFCPFGNLESFLTMRKGIFINQMDSDGNLSRLPHDHDKSCSLPDMQIQMQAPMASTLEPFKTMDLILWSIQIAQGMEYLHNKKVIHGDLAARNVLLTGDLRAKINDFGMSRRIYSYQSYVKSKQKLLPWQWMAPESFGKGRLVFSLESDIWSYGVTLWELFSLAELPFALRELNDDFVKDLQSGMVLPHPDPMPIKVYEIMLKCMEVDPTQRPSFSQIIEKLKTLLHIFDADCSRNKDEGEEDGKYCGGSSFENGVNLKANADAHSYVTISSSAPFVSPYYTFGSLYRSRPVDTILTMSTE